MYKTCTKSGQERWLVSLDEMLTYLHYPWEKCEKPTNRITLRTKSRMVAVSCFRARFSDQRSLLHVTRIGYTTSTLNDIRTLEFLATDFQHWWQKYFISLDWLKPETAHEKSLAPHSMTKRASQEIRHLHHASPLLHLGFPRVAV